MYTAPSVLAEKPQVAEFIAYYLTCVVGAGIVQLVVAALQGGIYPTIGASGGVFGLLF